MARIPIYQERQQASQGLPVPEMRAPNVGAESIGRSLQQVGQGLQTLAQGQIRVDDRNARLWANQISADEALHWTQRSEELKSTAPKGGAGYFQNINKEFQERANKILATAPDAASRQYLAQSFLSTRQNLLSRAIEFEVIEGRAYELDVVDTNTKKYALAAAQTKDPQLAMSYVGKLWAEIDASTLLPRQKLEFKKKAGQIVSSSLADAVAQDDPALAISILTKNAPVIKGDANKENLYLAIQQVESANNPRAVSPAGATGLMQVMPSTAMSPGFGLPNIFEYAKSKGLTVSSATVENATELLKDPKLGSEYGRLVFDAMLKRYDNNVVSALVAYNWGPGNADKWIANGSDTEKLPAETKKYVPNVLNRAGFTGETIGESKDSIFSMMPLGDQLKLLEKSRAGQSVQIIESTANAVYAKFGPQSDTDPIQLDVMDGHIDVLMADRPVDERKKAKELIKQMSQSFQTSSNQRQAAQVSGVWEMALQGQSYDEIIKSDVFKTLPGDTKVKLIGELQTFQTKGESLEQQAKYLDMVSNPQALAAMTNEQVIALAPSLGRKLTSDLLRKRADLNNPEKISAATIDNEDFNMLANQAGLKPFDTKKSDTEKASLGQLRYAVEQRIYTEQVTRKRQLTRDEKLQMMQQELDNKVMVDVTLWKDKQMPISLVQKDDLGKTYVVVEGKEVPLTSIPATSRTMIIRQLRAAGRPVTEQAIAEVFVQSRNVKVYGSPVPTAPTTGAK